MRIFWGLIVLLALAGAGLMLVSRSGPSRSSSASDEPTPIAGERAAKSTEVPAGGSTPGATPEALTPVAAAIPASTAAPVAKNEAETKAGSSGDPAKGTVDTKREVASPEKAASLEKAGVSDPSVKAGGDDKKATPFVFPEVAAFPLEKIIPAKGVVRPDGSIFIDDRFVVKGAGTKEDPYRVTWEQLVSAQDVYKPRLGQKRMPQRVTFLSGKYVRISGYVAFPITSNNPKECLVMLNQWDGCCIGVPPTAYDAVEVKLSKAANGNDRLAAHGTLEGKLVVDPYEEGGWLLGLYLMEDATLSPDL